MINNLPATDKVEVKGKKSVKNQVRSVVMYHQYLIAKGIELPYDERPEGKVNSMQIVSDSHDINKDDFYAKHNETNSIPSRKRLATKLNFIQAIALLKQHPKINSEAIKMAESEYKAKFPPS